MSSGQMKLIQSPYFQTGNPETEDVATTVWGYPGYTYVGMLGCFADFDQGTPGASNLCRYQLVKAASGITVAVGNGLVWSDKSAYTVTTDVTNRGQLAGVARVAAATAAGYFWMLKKGDRTGLFIASPTSAPDATGKPVVLSATNGKFDALANSLTQAAFPVAGTTLSVTASDLATVRWNIPDAF